MTGWLGALLMGVGGLLWGRQLRAHGVTLPTLLLTGITLLLGLGLSLPPALSGQPLPLVLGSVGALLLAMLAVFGD